MVSLVALVPLLLLVIVTIAAVQLALKRKLSAQAICVGEGLKLQAGLRTTLDSLLNLNPKAQALRAEHAAAVRAVQVAIATANGPGLVAARAALAGVEAAQVALAARQKSLLMQARWQRGEAKHRMERALRPLNPQQFNSGQRLSAPGLAVVPKPSTSITPDYVPVPNFSRQQSQSFSFSLDLGSRFLPLSWIQSAHCEVTLKGKEKAWQLQVLAASAP